jgi:hypothetical protein
LLTGRLWTNFQGEISIINHKANETCMVKFYPPSSVRANEVVGLIRDSQGHTKYVLDGSCTDVVKCSPVKLEHSKKFSSFEEHKKNFDLIDKNLRAVIWKKVFPP